MLNICRVDFIYAKLLLEKYIELDIGNYPTQSCPIQDRHEDDHQRHNTCEVTDEYPYVILLSDSGIGGTGGRKKRDIRRNKKMRKHRLAKLMFMNNGEE